MNTKLLRLVRHPRRLSQVAWVWTVPGFSNPVVLHKSHTFWKVPAVSWPHKQNERTGSETVRGGRIDWHRSDIKKEIRALLKRVAERLETC